MLGVVLAAGPGDRFARSGGEGPKQLAHVQGEAMVLRALRAALGAGLDEIAVVQGSVRLVDVVPPGVTLLTNPAWADGLASSLQVALVHAEARDHDAVVIGLADQPGVTTSAWAAVAAAPVAPPIAVATYAGRRANPVRLGASVWSALPKTGDEGARALMRRRPELVQEITCDGDPADVDTLEDLDRWQ